MRTPLLFILLFGAVLMAKAQDPNFSQFFASPLTLNPALTGKFDGAFRVAGNYRNQWPTINNAFITYTASIDAGILKNTIPEFDQFGVGLLAFKDQAGGGALNHQYLGLSTSYHKALDENGYHQLGLGFQGVYISKRLDITSLKFESMLRSDGFTGLLDESFAGNQISVSYFDMNMGMFYNGNTDGNNNFYFGASMYHVNRHKETFQKGNYLLEPRLTLQAGGRLPMGESDAIHFSANYSQQAGARNTIFGGAYMMNLNPGQPSPTNLYLGSWYRWGDALIPYVGLEFGEYHLGATYDVNISSLKPGSNMRGGIELSLIYIKAPSDPNAKKMNCPKF